MPNLRIVHPIRNCLRAVQEQGENVERLYCKCRQVSPHLNAQRQLIIGNEVLINL